MQEEGLTNNTMFQLLNREPKLENCPLPVSQSYVCIFPAKMYYSAISIGI